MANELTPSRRALKPVREDDMPRALLEFHSPSAGVIATPIRRGARSVIGIVTAMVATFIAIATLCPLNRVVTGTGVLSAVDRTIVVQPFDPSIIHSIDVHEGDIVEPGQVLAKLDPTVSEADVVNLRSQVSSLSAETARIRAEADGTDYRADDGNPDQTEEEAAFLQRQAVYRAQVQNYDEQIASARADLAGYQASASAFGQRLHVATDIQSMRLRLQQEAIGSRLNSLAAMDNVAEMQRSEAEAIENANSATGKIASLVAQRDAFEKNWRAEIYTKLTDAERKLDDAKDRLVSADLRHRLVVFRASKPAIVLTIAKVSVGSVLSPGAEFITLMPVDSKLEVEARIPAAQSGYVRLGDNVNLKFVTFPFLTYGGAVGTVENISADSFTGGDSDASVGLAGIGPDQSRAYYRARIAIDRYTLRDMPRGFHLVPGMPVTTDIKVGRRTIMQYLLSSVMPTMREGMREP